MLIRNFFRWLFIGSSDVEFESSIYPSTFRMRAFASLLLAISAVMAALHYMGQPELSKALGLIAIFATASLILLIQTYRPLLPFLSSAGLYAVLTWFTLSCASLWFYFLNGYSDFYFTALVICTSTYFLIKETRRAILGSLGTLIGFLILVWLLHKSFVMPPNSHILTMSLVYAGSIVFSLNNSRLHSQRINQTQALVRHMQRSLEPGLQGMNTLIPQLQQAAALLSDSASTERIEKIAKRLRRSTLSMQDYLDLQSINAQFLALNPSQQILSAHNLVHEAVYSHPFMTSSSQNAVALKLIDDFSFMGSRQQWLHMLRNILHNAVKALYAEKDRLSLGDITITISCTPKLGSISIRDRGTGIKTTHLQQIFHPFYTTDKNAGIGLGLSYCKQIAQTSGGVIKVVSNIHKGTRFDITLPTIEGKR